MMRKAMIGIVTSLLGVPASAQPVTIAALGDSLTQGYGLAVEDGFVAQLQFWADAQGVEVTLIMQVFQVLLIWEVRQNFI